MRNEKCWYKEVCRSECSDACIRYLEMDYLVQHSGIPALYQYPKALEPERVDYDSFCLLADYKDDVVDFVNSGKNLYIASAETGNGKTSWATKIMLKYFDSIWAGNGFRVRGLFLHVPTLLSQLKNFNNPLSEEYKQHILDADILVWDDIASTELSNYDLSQLLLYVDGRVNSLKSNIYTGNVDSADELQKLMGVRLASRIWNQSEVIILKGKDRRTTK